MKELDDILELMRGARGRWDTVRATLRHWEDTVLIREARRRYYGAPLPTNGEPRFMEAVHRIWARKPYRWRLEFDGPEGTNVFVGDLGWSEPPDAPRTERRGPPLDALMLEAIDATVAYTFDPWPVITELVLRVRERTEHAGREAVRILAVPEAGPTVLLGSDADDYELLVDVERGVLLRSAARVEGEEFRVTEVLDIAFDEKLSEDIFIAEDVFLTDPTELPLETQRPPDQTLDGLS